MRATTEQHAPGLWRVVVAGRPIVANESYGVAAAVESAINHPEWWEPSEAYEIARLAKGGS